MCLVDKKSNRITETRDAGLKSTDFYSLRTFQKCNLDQEMTML